MNRVIHLTIVLQHMDLRVLLGKTKEPEPNS